MFKFIKVYRVFYKYFMSKWVSSIVFLLDPVQGSGFGFDRVARVNSFFKSKRRRFSKKKVNGLQPDFCRVSRVTPGFFFSYFFFNPARFQPRIYSSGWAGLQNYGFYFLDQINKILNFLATIVVGILENTSDMSHASYFSKK
jgi:hypothetical protein